MAVCTGPLLRRRNQANLPEQGLRDQAVERHDSGEIGVAESVVGENEGGGGHIPAAIRGRNIYHYAEIQMMVVQSGDQPPGREVFKPNVATIMLRRSSSASTQRGPRENIRSAAPRASRSTSATVTRKASANCAPASTLSRSTSGWTSRTVMTGVSCS